MILTVASYKGGVGKTTTAVHLAQYLNERAPTLLLDGDPTRNATAWSRRGSGFDFPVAPVEQAAKLARNFAHVVIDTGQRPSLDDLQAAMEGCELLVVPGVPSALDTDGLGQTLRALEEIRAKTNGAAAYKVLLTRVAPDAGKQQLELLELLREIGAPAFATAIPRLKAFEKAASEGRTVNYVRDANAERAWAAYQAAGAEVLA